MIGFRRDACAVVLGGGTAAVSFKTTTEPLSAAILERLREILDPLAGIGIAVTSDERRELLG